MNIVQRYQRCKSLQQEIEYLEYLFFSPCITYDMLCDIMEQLYVAESEYSKIKFWWMV